MYFLECSKFIQIEYEIDIDIQIKIYTNLDLDRLICKGIELISKDYNYSKT